MTPVAFYTPVKHPQRDGALRRSRARPPADGCAAGNGVPAASGEPTPHLSARLRPRGRRAGRARRGAHVGPADRALPSAPRSRSGRGPGSRTRATTGRPISSGPASPPRWMFPTSSSIRTCRGRAAARRSARGSAPPGSRSGAPTSSSSMSPRDRPRVAECRGPRFAAERILDLPPAVDLARFEASAERRAACRAALGERFAEREGPLILAVAAMREVKKLEPYRMLADALRRLQTRAPTRSWRLAVVGDGPARSEVTAAFSALPPGRIRFLGSLEPEVLPTVYLGADLFAFPGRFHVVYLQAAAAGLPVVACAGPGPDPMVAPGGALLTEPSPTPSPTASPACSTIRPSGRRWVPRPGASSRPIEPSRRSGAAWPRGSPSWISRALDLRRADPPRADRVERRGARPRPGGPAALARGRGARRVLAVAGRPSGAGGRGTARLGGEPAPTGRGNRPGARRHRPGDRPAPGRAGLGRVDRAAAGRRERRDAGGGLGGDPARGRISGARPRPRARVARRARRPPRAPTPGRS